MKDLKKKDLLVDIAALAGFYYLSDIRQERSRGAVCIALQQIASENYSCAEWIEAAEYIIGKRPVNVSGSKDVVEFILQNSKL